MRRAALILAIVFSVAWAPEPHLFGENLSDSTSLSDNLASLSVAGQSIHDVSIIDVQASSLSVSRGTVIDINVSIQNLGTSDESFSLGLKDNTDSQEIISVSLAMSPGQTLNLGLPWDTSIASAGLHSITAHADLTTDQFPGNNSATTSMPIEVIPTAIILGDGNGLESPDASFSGTLGSPGISTQKQPSSNMFIGGHDAAFRQSQSRAGVSTVGGQHQGVYIANADATFASSESLGNPFQQGQIQGRVHLEGLQSSVGAYIEVGPKQHFVDAGGGFQIAVPSGTYDLVIQAPGYVPVRIPQTTVNSGDLLTIPELTLPFGDANGDGKIDILDLSIAAANFGATVQEVTAP